MSSPYDVLGISAGAKKDEVKEAYRRLCKQLHPDLCAPEDRKAAERRFKEVTNAYQTLVQGSKPIRPPPPGTPPTPLYEHVYKQQGSKHSFGRYAGYNSEFDFYRAWFKTSRNSAFMLSMAGLIGVPLVTGIWMIMNGHVEFFQRMRKDGLDAVKQSYDVNGIKTTLNPYIQTSVEDSYIYKHEKYAHLRGRRNFGRGSQFKQEDEESAEAPASTPSTA